jgi:hypothetical protein
MDPDQTPVPQEAPLPKAAYGASASRALGRSSVEAYAAMGIAIATVAFPMTWYFRVILIVIVGGLIVHLIFRSSLTLSWRLGQKLFCSVAALALLGGASWRPIYEDYIGQELPNVTLQFIYPAHPALQIHNVSGSCQPNQVYRHSVES